MGAGLLIGLIWLVFAPRAGAIVKGGEAVPVSAYPEQYAAADALLVVLFAVAGIATAVVATRAFARSEWGILAGIVIGGLLGSVVAAGLGGALGWTDPSAQAAGALDGTPVMVSLELRTPSALLIWPFMAALVYFFSAAFTRKPPAGEEK